MGRYGGLLGFKNLVIGVFWRLPGLAGGTLSFKELV